MSFTQKPFLLDSHTPKKLFAGALKSHISHILAKISRPFLSTKKPAMINKTPTTKSG